MISIAGLTILLSTMTVSYLGSTGTANATVSAASSAFIYPVAATGHLPAAVTSLKYTVAGDISSATINTAVVPSWAPTALSAGSVTTAGDIALIDGTIASSGVVVSLYITNLSGLQSDYSSFAFPIDIYSSPCTSNACTWTQASTIVTAGSTFLTSTSGYMTFNLPAGSYYDIVFDTGGSYYCSSTSTAGTATLTPSFYLTAQPY